ALALSVHLQRATATTLGLAAATTLGRALPLPAGGLPADAVPEGATSMGVALACDIPGHSQPPLHVAWPWMAAM
ncbi:hypothetical protein GW17_00060820, partial [Ensete ventricosum]